MANTSDNLFTLYSEVYAEQKAAKKKTTPDVSNGVIVPYKTYSNGAKALSTALGIVNTNRDFAVSYIRGACYVSDPNTGMWKTTPERQIPFLINWGTPNISSKRTWLEDWARKAIKRVVNDPAAVTIASNKRLFFEAMKKTVNGPRIPDFTTDITEAQKWAEEGCIVMGRKEHGSSGKDIAFFDSDPDDFIASELWTKYQKKKKEFRLHWMNGGFFLLQQKVLPKNDPDGNPIPKDNVDFRIRTHRTGFIFQQNDIKVPQDVFEQAERAIKAIGLDFGAIDVIYNQHDDKAFVLEINTAPGLDGSTPELYAKEFKKLLSLS